MTDTGQIFDPVISASGWKTRNVFHPFGQFALQGLNQPMPLKAQDCSADDLGVMSISLKDVVKPTIGFQGALQGAGTPSKQVSAGSCPSLLMTTASGSLMSSLTRDFLVPLLSESEAVRMVGWYWNFSL